MRLFLLDRSFHGQKRYLITGKDAHYLADVLRLPVGQTITARDMDAALWLLKLLEIRRDGCLVETSLLEQVRENTDTLPEYQDLKPIVLYQCITKPKKLEQIVRQATEIGVSCIVPVQSTFSCREPFKTERLEAQLKEAIQQSGSLVPTRICEPVPLAGVPGHFSDFSKGAGTALFFHQTRLPDQRHLSQVLPGLTAPAGILIGAEGGLDNDECELLRQGNFEPVLLDTNILRAETAAIYALALVQSAIQTNVSGHQDTPGK